LISKRLLRRRAREASEAPDEEVFEEDEEGEEEAESEGELGNDEDLDENCIVCMDQPRDATVMPCRHMVLCSRCAGALRYRTDVQHRCPICRTEIESVLEEDEQLEKARGETAPHSELSHALTLASRPTRRQCSSCRGASAEYGCMLTNGYRGREEAREKIARISRKKKGKKALRFLAAVPKPRIKHISIFKTPQEIT